MRDDGERTSPGNFFGHAHSRAPEGIRECARNKPGNQPAPGKKLLSRRFAAHRKQITLGFSHNNFTLINLDLV